MTRIASCLCLIAVTLLTGCGGGGSGSSSGGVVGGGGGGGSTSVVGSFTSAQPAPSPGQVTMSAVASGTSSNLVTVAVLVTGVNDVFNASFDVNFNPSIATFVNWSAGAALESGGATVSYQMDATSPGKLVVGISRIGSTSGANIPGSAVVVNLTFRVLTAGSTAVAMSNADLLNSSSPPQPISGISFSGGTLTAQ